eukprot:12928924-Prorocentrum_lima.AAC.1
MSCTRSLQRPCLEAAAGDGQQRQKKRARQGKFPGTGGPFSHLPIEHQVQASDGQLAWLMRRTGKEVTNQFRICAATGEWAWWLHVGTSKR